MEKQNEVTREETSLVTSFFLSVYLFLKFEMT